MDIKIEKRNKIQRKHYVYGIFLVIVLIGLWKILSSYSTKSYTIDEDKLRISEVIFNKFDDYIVVNGSVEPISTIFMDAHEGGTVKEKLIEEGSMVKKGDVILTLENRSLYEQILASENNLALKQNDLRSTKLAFDARQNQGRKELVQSDFELKRAKRAYEQNKSLFEEELIAKEVYLTSKENYELAQQQNQILIQQTQNDQDLRNNSLRELDADLERMRRTLGMVYERLEELKVKAPADGQLGFLDAEIGQQINQGDRIAQLNILSDYKVLAFIDEHYSDRVKKGLSARLERNGQHFNLKVKKVYPEVREGKFKVDFVFEDARPENSKTGQTYKINLQLGESKEAVMIPKGGFFQTTGGHWIFALDESGKFAVKTPIKLGKQNTNYYEVLEGLNPRDRVITSSYRAFEDVEKIEIRH